MDYWKQTWKNIEDVREGYCGWAPYADWLGQTSETYDSWSKFYKAWGAPNDLNEVIDFYFTKYDKTELNLWITQPRKGRTRGVEIKNIARSDIPHIFRYLDIAKKRFLKKFKKITSYKGDGEKIDIIERANKAMSKKKDLTWRASDIGNAIHTRIPIGAKTVGMAMRWGLKNMPHLCKFEVIKAGNTHVYRWNG